jgi:hypothetical protein
MKWEGGKKKKTATSHGVRIKPKDQGGLKLAQEQEDDEEITASVPRSRVWWLGRKRSAALDDGATGGISAIILRAHNLAAAKVRLQSLQIQDGTCKAGPPTRPNCSLPLN